MGELIGWLLRQMSSLGIQTAECGTTRSHGLVSECRAGSVSETV